MQVRGSTQVVSKPSSILTTALKSLGTVLGAIPDFDVASGFRTPWLFAGLERFKSRAAPSPFPASFESG